MTSEEVYQTLCKVLADYAYMKLIEVDDQGFIRWKDETKTI